MGRYILGVSGASGVGLAKKALRWLTQLGHEVDLVVSKGALYTASQELGISKAEAFLDGLPDPCLERVTLHRNSDIGASIASGSCLTDGMLILPCSMATVAAISIGLGDNLIRRAADVTLKERRPLVIVPREAPLSAIHLENLLKLSRVGASIVPPVPAWYQGATTLDEMENGILARTLDQLGLQDIRYNRWAGGGYVEKRLRWVSRLRVA